MDSPRGAAIKIGGGGVGPWGGARAARLLRAGDDLWNLMFGIVHSFEWVFTPAPPRARPARVPSPTRPTAVDWDIRVVTFHDKHQRYFLAKFRRNERFSLFCSWIGQSGRVSGLLGVRLQLGLPWQLRKARDVRPGEASRRLAQAQHLRELIFVRLWVCANACAIHAWPPSLNCCPRRVRCVRRGLG